MKRWLLMMMSAWCVAMTATARAFDDDFQDSTLRLNYVLAGNAKQQHIYYCNASKQARWAGRKARLAEIPLRGNGQIMLIDHETGRQLYVHTFSTLFQEWQAEEEATRVDRAFQASFNVPMPKRPVDVKVTLTDFHAQVKGLLQHTINPADILIRRIDEPQETFRYVWTGKTLPNGQPDTIPHVGLWRQTPAGTHYDTFYSNRYLMTSEMHRIYDLLSGIPFEHIIVLVNSSTYGGGGIYNQLTVTTSDHPTFRPVLVHEFGHAYGGLGDEYFYDDGYETMYPDDTEPWEPNLTTLVDFQSKWADMVPRGTPIPTPPAKTPEKKRGKKLSEREQLNALTQRVGVFEGGGYQSKGVFRPAQECRMKINEVENFCPVCARALVRITDFYTSQ